MENSQEPQSTTGKDNMASAASRKRAKQKKHEEATKNIKTGLKLKDIEPKTTNQNIAFEAFEDGQNILLHGLAGTGKSFIGLYLALEEVLNGNDFDKIYLVRSTVPTRDLGFLPGNEKEKTKPYEAPYYGICSELFGRGDAYEVLKKVNLLEFMTTSFLRGITLNNCIMIVEEIQNMTFQELDSLITRLGDNSLLILNGDFRQSDFRFDNDKQGIMDIITIVDKMPSFSHIEFGIEDIVRSGLVKEYIIAKSKGKYR
jgi:phosphate starvation-inducible protein PhoH